jgi:hypothetical protein
MENKKFDAVNKIKTLKNADNLALLHYPIREYKSFQRSGQQTCRRSRLKKLFSLLQHAIGFNELQMIFYKLVHTTPQT